MVLLGIFLLVSVIGFMVHFIRKWDECGLGIGLVFGIMFLVGLVAIPVAQYDTTISILRFNEAQRALSDARANEDISELELAAIQRVVIEQNQWLVEQKRWKTNLFVGVYTHSDILELKPIR